MSKVEVLSPLAWKGLGWNLEGHVLEGERRAVEQLHDRDLAHLRTCATVD
jgi:hypothetical protein